MGCPLSAPNYFRRSTQCGDKISYSMGRSIRTRPRYFAQKSARGACRDAPISGRIEEAGRRPRLARRLRPIHENERSPGRDPIPQNPTRTFCPIIAQTAQVLGHSSWHVQARLGAKRKTRKWEKLDFQRAFVVGAAGIEPATPTMSTQCPAGCCPVLRAKFPRCPNSREGVS